MIFFGVYETRQINHFLADLSSRLLCKYSIQSLFFSWGEGAKNELSSLGVDSIFLPEPNAFLEAVCLDDGFYTSKITEERYDINWVVEVERHFLSESNSFDSLRNRACMAIEFYEEVFLLSPPGVVILWNGEQMYNRIFRLLSKLIGAPVYFVERGPLPGTMFFDEKGVNAASSFFGRKLTSSCSATRDWIDRRVEVYLSDNTSAWSQPGMLSLGDLCSTLAIPSYEKIVFLPLQVDHDTNMILHSPQFSSSWQMIEFVCEKYHNIPDLTLLVRNHPKSINPISMRDLSRFSNCKLVDDISVKQLLPICHHVVTNNSTVGFEALLFGKPVIVMGNAFYSRVGLTYEGLDEFSLAAILEEGLDNGVSSQAKNFLSGLYEKGFLIDMTKPGELLKFQDRIGSLQFRNSVFRVGVLEVLMARVDRHEKILSGEVRLRSLNSLLKRLQSHFLIGFVWKAWARMFNSSLWKSYKSLLR